MICLVIPETVESLESMESHGITRNHMESHGIIGITLNHTESHGITRNHWNHWNHMESHGITWNQWNHGITESAFSPLI